MNNTIKIIAREWLPGDLVRIKSSQWDGRPHESIGIVLSCSSSREQLRIFPQVMVYDSKIGEPRKYYCYDIELITAAL